MLFRNFMFWSANQTVKLLLDRPGVIYLWLFSSTFYERNCAKKSSNLKSKRKKVLRETSCKKARVICWWNWHLYDKKYYNCLRIFLEDLLTLVIFFCRSAFCQEIMRSLKVIDKATLLTRESVLVREHIT
jgi:hypothetical protein